MCNAQNLFNNYTEYTYVFDLFNNCGYNHNLMKCSQLFYDIFISFIRHLSFLFNKKTKDTLVLYNTSSFGVPFSTVYFIKKRLVLYIVIDNFMYLKKFVVGKVLTFFSKYIFFKRYEMIIKLIKYWKNILV